MTEKPFYLSGKHDTINIKEEVSKYVRNWPWFLFASLVFLSVAFFYLRYASITYQTTGKIKILDESSKSLELPEDITSLFESSKVNLENEIEVIKSYRILKKVVSNLNLNVRYFEEGKIKSKEVWGTPFKISEIDSLNTIPKNKAFTIKVLPNGYNIIGLQDKEWNINTHTIDSAYTDLPFIIKSVSPSLIQQHIGKTYKVNCQSVSQVTLGLSSKLKISQVGKSSDILSLSYIGESTLKSEAIINEIIRQFNLDGVLDRQLVSQRTIDFVDERFIYLSKELDSIENDKKGFKQRNSLSDIELDTEYTIVRKANTSDEVLRLETQLEIASLLKATINNQKEFDLLPANIGLENVGVNTLISDYNLMITQRERIIKSAGKNNPVYLNLNSQLTGLKANILRTVTAYEKQSETALKKANIVNNKTNGLFSGIPQKEKILRAIERQQNIKENLYVLLLQKREEAAISLAVTSLSIKVVDYAITSMRPISPKSANIYLLALIMGFLLPFSVFFVLFQIDSRIHTKEDQVLKDSSIPIIAEIPFTTDEKKFKNFHDRSILSEAFRVLRTNTEHLLNPKHTKSDTGKTIYITSTIKGEGKTFTAINLTGAYAALGKKVLLIGADLRNPQIHSYFKTQRKVLGLSDYLKDDTLNINEIITDYDLDSSTFGVLFSGNVPSTPAELLSNGRFENLLNEVKRIYDYIVVDTAPTILVTDTMLIAPYADATLYVLRSRFTEKKLLAFSKELIESGKLVNSNYLLNGLLPSRLYGYNYNYGYNYGYNYKAVKKPWYLKLFRS